MNTVKEKKRKLLTVENKESRMMKTDALKKFKWS